MAAEAGKSASFGRSSRGERAARSMIPRLSGKSKAATGTAVSVASNALVARPDLMRLRTSPSLPSASKWTSKESTTAEIARPRKSFSDLQRPRLRVDSAGVRLAIKVPTASEMERTHQDPKSTFSFPPESDEGNGSKSVSSESLPLKLSSGSLGRGTKVRPGMGKLAIKVPPTGNGKLAIFAEPKTTFTFPLTPTDPRPPPVPRLPFHLSSGGSTIATKAASAESPSTLDGAVVAPPEGRRRSFAFPQPAITPATQLSQSYQPAQLNQASQQTVIPRRKPRLPAVDRIVDEDIRTSKVKQIKQRRELKGHGRQASYAGSIRSFTPIGSFDAPVVPEGSQTVQPGNVVYASFVMARHIYSIAQTERWFKPASYPNAVAVRVNVGNYVLYPQDNFVLGSFSEAVFHINCDAAIIISTPLVSAALSTLEDGSAELRIAPGKRVQVLESIGALSGARRAQMAAFLAHEGVLVLWTESCRDLIAQVRAFEALLSDYVWKVSTAESAKSTDPLLENGSQSRKQSTEHGRESSSGSPGSSIRGTAAHVNGGGAPSRYVEPRKGMSAVAVNELLKEQNFLTDIDVEHLESYTAESSRVPWLAGAIRGASACVALLAVAAWSYKIVSAVRQDSEPLYLVALIAVPAIYLTVLPVVDMFVTSVAMALGPVLPMRSNSRYYSGRPPQPPVGKIALPHVTIQVPVYRESMDTVLQPTLDSLRAAVTEYELRGGTASILVAEDGMLVVDEEEQTKRLDVYRRHDIAWIARPQDGPTFERRGRFKKASNLNFSMQIALGFEKAMEADPDQDADDVLQRLLKERHPDAIGEGNVRIGDIILLVDSDTRVPADSLLPSAWEMATSPDVAILQHCSGMLIVGSGFFERSMAYFMRCVHFFTSWQTATGEVAPFIGHNAFIRKAALEELAVESLVSAEGTGGGDGLIRPWSEETVSEDLDMGLRLLLRGWITRWATYSNYGFEMGVSLTYADEVNRWRKYTFGVFELFLNPLWRWPLHGPVPKLIRQVMGSSRIPLHYRWQLLAYGAGYVAIGISLPLSFALYLVEGWLGPWLLDFFLPSFRTWTTALLVFGGSGLVALTIARHRTGDANIFHAFFSQLLWYPLNLVTITSLSLHVIKTQLDFLLSIPASFGVTAKDDTHNNFVAEARVVLRDFWQSSLVALGLVGAIAVLATDAVPMGWQITEWPIILPTAFLCVATLVAPVVLSPNMIRFSF